MIRFSTRGTLLAFLPLLAPFTAAQDLEYGKQPIELGHDAARVGEWIPDLGFTDVRGESSSLSTIMGEHGLVIAMRDPDCPLCKKYSPRLARLEGELEELGFGLLFVGNHEQDLAQQDVKTYSLKGHYAVDPESVIARELAAKTSTEVFVLDKRRTLVYRGMIDDQYGLGFAKKAPERAYLQQALEAVIAGDPVVVPATLAQGCLLELSDEPRVTGEVTYHERISRIVQKRCETCHRPGASGPFSLTSFKDVTKRKRMIRYVLKDDLMPPWFADEESGPWANDCSIPAEEERDFMAWLTSGAPEGDPANAPLPVERIDEWTIGVPDLVVELPEPFTVPAEGVVDYQYMRVKTDFAEDRWVQAVEIKAGSPTVVHHVLVLVDDPTATKRRQDASEGYFASMVPGQRGLVYPEGCAKRLPAGAWLTFQMHYTPNGVETTDQSKIGLIFTEEPVRREVQTTSAIDTGFAIPPEAFDFKVTGDYRFDQDAEILSIFPHSHLRGVRFLVELILPNGHREQFLELPFYDFNWQYNYELAKPRLVQKGTHMRVTGWYDNTSDNPSNPDPTQWVRFGEQTFEEMMIGYVNWVPARTGPVEASAPVKQGSGGQ